MLLEMSDFKFIFAPLSAEKTAVSPGAKEGWKKRSEPRKNKELFI